jgi:hypothetical protein
MVTINLDGKEIIGDTMQDALKKAKKAEREERKREAERENNRNIARIYALSEIGRIAQWYDKGRKHSYWYCIGENDNLFHGRIKLSNSYGMDYTCITENGTVTLNLSSYMRPDYILQDVCGFDKAIRVAEDNEHCWYVVAVHKGEYAMERLPVFFNDYLDTFGKI